MLLLIQNSQNGLYYKGPTEWVSSEAEAKWFSNALSVYNLCHQQGLKNVDIVIKDRRKPRPVMGRFPFELMA